MEKKELTPEEIAAKAKADAEAKAAADAEEKARVAAEKAAEKERKAAERKAEQERKKAEREAEKQRKAEERAAEKERKAKEREEAKAAKAAEREAAKAAKEAEKAEAAAKREAERMPEQNGVRRPKPDTLCGKAWGLMDTLSAQFGQATPVAPLLEAARAQGLNEGNVKAEYARWRKFHGITGRVTLPKAEEPAAPAEEKGGEENAA